MLSCMTTSNHVISVNIDNQIKYNGITLLFLERDGVMAMELLDTKLFMIHYFCAYMHNVCVSTQSCSLLAILYLQRLICNYELNIMGSILITYIVGSILFGLVLDKNRHSYDYFLIIRGLVIMVRCSHAMILAK